jgi:hypothetical protein
VEDDSDNTSDDDGYGFGSGFTFGGSVVGGAGIGGGAATGTLGYGQFFDSRGGRHSAAVFASGGTAAYLKCPSRCATGDAVVGLTEQQSSPVIFGESAGAGFGLFLTSARSGTDLEGPFSTWQFNLPAGSVEWDRGGRTWVLTISPAAAGRATPGASYFQGTTSTTVHPAPSWIHLDGLLISHTARYF